MSIQVGAELDLYSNYPSNRRQPSAPSANGVARVDKQIVEVWETIFGFLPCEDLARCSTLSKFHQYVGLESDVWKECAARSDEKGLAHNIGFITHYEGFGWRDVCSHINLSRFVSTLEEHEIDELGDFIEVENPEYNPHEDPRTEIWRPIAVSGEMTCSISNSFDIQVTNVSTGRSRLIVGEAGNGLQLTHLYADKKFLYALRSNGTIVQCNLEQARILQKIPTGLSRGVIQGLNTPIVARFLVQDQKIILKYGDQRDTVLEIIHAENPNHRVLITDRDIPQPNQMVIHDNKLYVLGNSRLFVWDLNQSRKIWVKDIETEKNDRLAHLAVSKNLVCVAGSGFLARGPVIYVIDINKKKIIHTHEHTNYQIANFIHMEIMGNLLIARADMKDKNFDPEEDVMFMVEKEVIFMDLNSGDFLDQEPLNFESPSGRLRNDALKTIVNKAIDYRNFVENPSQPSATCAIQ